MLLTASLLSKGSFFGSLLNKCRQVAQTIRNKKTNNETKLQRYNDNSLKPHAATATTTTTTTKLTTNPTITDVRTTKSIQLLRPALSSPVAGLKTLEEKIGLPPRPKKPLTPYFRYMREQRPKMTAEHPKVANTELVRLISQSWVTADPKEKQRLQEEYKREQQQYIEQRSKYDAKISDEQRAEIKQLKQDLAEAKDRKHMRKRVKELGRPKKPASGFLRFIITERKETPQLPKQTYREWHQKCTAKWARLSDNEKLPYLEETRKEMEKYKLEMSTWEEKMVRLGNVDVVRHINLIDPPEPKPRKQ